MYRKTVFLWQVAKSVDSVARYVEKTAAYIRTDRHFYRRTGRHYFHATVQSVGYIHRYAPESVLSDLLLNFENNLVPVVTGYLQRIESLWKVFTLRRELNIDHRAYNFYNLAF